LIVVSSSSSIRGGGGAGGCKKLQFWKIFPVELTLFCDIITLNRLLSWKK
jgi:hypothetical protein